MAKVYPVLSMLALISLGLLISCLIDLRVDVSIDIEILATFLSAVGAIAAAVAAITANQIASHQHKSEIRQELADFAFRANTGEVRAARQVFSQLDHMLTQKSVMLPCEVPLYPKDESVESVLDAYFVQTGFLESASIRLGTIAIPTNSRILNDVESMKWHVIQITAWLKLARVVTLGEKYDVDDVEAFDESKASVKASLEQLEKNGWWDYEEYKRKLEHWLPKNDFKSVEFADPAIDDSW